jgi:hypothetical protein
MKYLFVFFISLWLLASPQKAYSFSPLAGDTVKVQTFRYGSKQDSVFLFPPDTFSCSKILMYYKLRCPYNGACGEWDYLTYTYLYKPTGKIDSYQVKSPFFVEAGQTPDSFSFMKKPTWAVTYDPITKKVDSTLNKPFNILFYRNNSKPDKATDTIMAWPTSFSIHYDTILHKADTNRIAADTMIRQKFYSWYRKYPDNIRYELARYITPYGNGLSLGNGFTWVYDVTDYAPLLHDSVHLSAGNWQEMLDMSFAFIKGKPARKVLNIQNLWNGQPAYGTATSIETFLKPLTVKLDANANSYRIKMRTTGHGFGGTDNCSEFCPRLHSIDVDGVTRFQDTMFRYDCSRNPVYPQGGTWSISRANWCPGSTVQTYNYELSKFVKPGDSVKLDYNVQPYKWNGVGTTPYYSIETQLISYDVPNFHSNVSIEDIIAPSNGDIYKRLNPSCAKPTILIKNNGIVPLKSLVITYGVQGTTPWTYYWKGNLGYLDTTTVVLDGMSWAGTSNIFSVTLGNPNDIQDEQPQDNTMSSYFNLPPNLPAKFLIELQTNKAASDNSYTLKNAFGTVIKERHNLANNTFYSDTANLKPGCYTLELLDAGDDGLEWWANPAAGSGFFDLRKVKGPYLKSFNPDFGSQVYFQFTVGSFSSGIEDGTDKEARINIYPNPGKGRFTLALSLPDKENISIVVYDCLGKELLVQRAQVTASEVPIELTGYPKGIYVVKISTVEGVYCRKIFIE